MGATAGGNDKLCVRLRNISNPDQIWEISLSGGVLIRRDAGCQVCIDEKSMSRRQCGLYIDATGRRPLKTSAVQHHPAEWRTVNRSAQNLGTR